MARPSSPKDGLILLKVCVCDALADGQTALGLAQYHHCIAILTSSCTDAIPQGFLDADPSSDAFSGTNGDELGSLWFCADSSKGRAGG